MLCILLFIAIGFLVILHQMRRVALISLEIRSAKIMKQLPAHKFRRLELLLVLSRLAFPFIHSSIRLRIFYSL